MSWEHEEGGAIVTRRWKQLTVAGAVFVLLLCVVRVWWTEYEVGVGLALPWMNHRYCTVDYGISRGFNGHWATITHSEVDGLEIYHSHIFFKEQS